MDVDTNQFEIVIDFSKGGNPNRVFRSMAELLETIQNIDTTLAEVVGVKVSNTLALEDIQEGSLKTIIRNIIQDIPDEDLRDANFQRLLGFYLVKAKYAVLEWCQNTTKLTSIDQVEVLEGKLVSIAEEMNVNSLPAYKKPNRVKLLTNINTINKSMQYLQDNDGAYYNCNEGSSKINHAMKYQIH